MISHLIGHGYLVVSKFLNFLKGMVFFALCPALYPLNKEALKQCSTTEDASQSIQTTQIRNHQVHSEAMNIYLQFASIFASFQT